MDSERLLDLLNRHKDGTLTDTELQDLENWYNSLRTGSVEIAQDELTNDKLTEELLTDFRQKWLHDLPSPAPVRKMTSVQKFIRIAAVVTGITFLGVGYLLFFKKPKDESVKVEQPAYQSDIAPPAGNKAILTLADGSKIELDNADNGTLAVQGKINITKQANGQIVYNGTGTDKISYNTLSLPKGSRPSKLTLADGSQIWLNTASSITYPTAFTGKERRVKITGEAYFEIAKNAAMAFYVEYNKGEVKVLGTHFNVNAYADEKDARVTLLEGSVRFSAGDKTGELKPGQQAQVTDNSVNVVNEVDMESVMSWKQGRFYFDGAEIKTIMRQVEKWYNVEVHYEADISDSFVAKMSRDENLSELLRIIQLTNLVHFKIEENKITVMK